MVTFQNNCCDSDDAHQNNALYSPRAYVLLEVFSFRAACAPNCIATRASCFLAIITALNPAARAFSTPEFVVRGNGSSQAKTSDCATASGVTLVGCYNFRMNVQLDLPHELEVVLYEIATREKRDVNEVIQGVLERFAAEKTKPLPEWVGIGEGTSDLSGRVDELLFQDGLRP
jgi:hypothetical protein